MDERSRPAPLRATGDDHPVSWVSRWLARLRRLKGPLVAVAAGGSLVGGLAGYWNGWRTLHAGVAQVTASTTKVAGPVVPFSTADRRMTFAVLPFHSPAGDGDAARMALAAVEVTQSEQEHNSLWGRVVPHSLVEQQISRPQTLSELGQALNVHFLYRGDVTKSDSGYVLALALVDAATERVLGQSTIVAVADAAGPRLPAKTIQDATYRLTYDALIQEVAQARDKPDAQLDVRDLAFRAMVEQNRADPDRARVYAATMKDLNRARALAPDDLLTLRLIAQVNLCECLKAWAADDRPMEEIGLAALDKALTLQPDSSGLLNLRFINYWKHGRFQEALLVNDALLAKEPADGGLLAERATVLRALGQVKQAVAVVPSMLKAADDNVTDAVAAEVYFASGDDAQAARLARKSLVMLTRQQRTESERGSVALVLAAAQARSGHVEEARKALQDFWDAVPKARTVGQIKAWLSPSWVAPGGDAFWDALRRSGVAA